jgi:hypothetical protein
MPSLVIVLLGLLSAPLSHGQQPLLRITSPASGSVIAEGQTITTTVSADPSVRVIGVLSDGPFPSLQATSHSNQFCRQFRLQLTLASTISLQWE